MPTKMSKVSFKFWWLLQKPVNQPIVWKGYSYITTMQFLEINWYMEQVIETKMKYTAQQANISFNSLDNNIKMTSDILVRI